MTQTGIARGLQSPVLRHRVWSCFS